MKKIIASFIFILIVTLVNAQVKTNTQISPMAAPSGGGGGGCTYCYQWNMDRDHDGFGDPSIFVLADTKPAGYVADQSDCNDLDASINPNTIWYRDADGDGYGSSSQTIAQCTKPSGYINNSLDYDDNNVNITNIPPSTFYRDIDNDGFGSASSGTVYYSLMPSGYSNNNSDCNDYDASLNPNTVWYRDADGDGYGNGGITTNSCSQPGGYVRNNYDCNDGDSSLNPNTVWYRDADGDGYGNPGVTTNSCTQPGGYVRDNNDCNDNNSSINPNNIWYRDYDGDGYGGTMTTHSCTQPGGYVSNSLDCDDYRAEVNPYTVWYRDSDGDGFGRGPTIEGCNQPAGYVLNNLDCNDADSSLNPNTVWYRDADGDGYGNGGVTTNSCIQPGGYVRNAADYNDSTGNITNIQPQYFYQDADGDGFGNPSVYVYYSYQPGGYVSNGLDCNDGDSSLNPNTVWYRDADGDGYGNGGVTTNSCIQPGGYVRNAADYNDSTGNITNIQPQYFYQDADGDGFGNPSVYVYYSYQPGGYVTNGSDCNDGDSSLNPGTVWYRDADGDGYGNGGVTTNSCTQPGGYVRNGADYNDSTGNITNIAPQYFYQDADGDGYGNPNAYVYYSYQPGGYITNNTDCNDGDATLNPNTVWYRDADGDGYGNGSIATNSCTQPGGYVRNAADYNDSTGNITNVQPQYFYQDADGDGYGNPNAYVYYSYQPGGYVTNGVDCNDGDYTLNPNTVWYRDADSDGYGNPNVATNSCTQPGGYVRNAADYDDNTGNITNVAPQYFYQDADGDGYGNGSVYVYYSYQPGGYVTNGNDYNDSTSNITNLAPQYFYQDADNDGFGNPSINVYYSNRPNGYVTNNGDCNDGDSSLNPNTVWYRDADGDGYGNGGVTTTSCTQPGGYVRNAADYNDSTSNITNIAPQYFYQDADNDGFGNPNVSVYYSTMPAGYVTNNGDCNDGDSSLTPSTVWYQDADGDGYGNANQTLTQCNQPGGYIRNAGDYNDSTANITNIQPQYFYQDADNDGFGNPNVSVYYSNQPYGYVTNNGDCNDGDSSLNPNTVWYRDSDGDGYGNVNQVVSQCNQLAGYVRVAGDYDDTTINITNIAPDTFYQDADGDTYGNPNVSVYYSAKPVGYVKNNTDFDDTTTNITNIAPQNFYQDADTDGFGNAGVALYYSVQPQGYVTNYTDCDDNNAGLNPNTKWYADNDLDGLGDPSSFVQQCTAPTGNYVTNNTDNCPTIKGSGSNCSDITSPSSDRNYIITKTYKQPTATVLDTPGVEQVQTAITYFDGLGRPAQQIANRQSSAGKDIITHIDYDDFGRQIKEYLSYEASTTTMEFDTNAETNTLNFYNKAQYDNTSNPFSEKKLEFSPLNRVLKQAAPGTSWAMNSGHEIKLDYQTNTESEVKSYQATATWDAGSGLYSISFSDEGNYGHNELYKNITYDENTAASPTETSGSTVEFKDKEGKVVLKRTYESGTKHDTYYVYDQYRNLTYVIPPKADGVINSAVLDDLCYQYKYDYRNRLVEKKLPGKQWEFIVYDKLDRPVATGPALSPFKDDSNIGWIITKYDAFGRPVYTGWNNVSCNSASRKTLQDNQNAATVLYETKETSGSIDGITVNYSNTIAPTSFKLLTVTYYDNYDYPNAPTVPTTVEGQTVLANAKTLATGSWTRVATISSENLTELTTTFYDEKARPIRTYVSNHLGGYTSTDNKLDFSGKTLYTISKHKRNSGSTELVIKEDFTYSAQDRLLTHTHQINGGTAQLLADNTYDALGQLESKKTGNISGNPLQKVDFNYNIRGWLTRINKIEDLQQSTDPRDLFAFKINYDQVDWDANAAKALYNGNIAETKWISGSDVNGIVRGYGYQYDKLNRLKEAIYQTPSLTDNQNYFGESMDYDKNGNINHLWRKNIAGTTANPYVGGMDDLTYEYKNDNSNQLAKVTESLAGNDNEGFIDGNKTGNDYEYDANGNLISDKNKNITGIEYNQLNLPKKITFGTGNTIEYIYNAAGQKLEKIVKEGAITTTTNYLGGFQYKNDVLEFFPTTEGYVKNDNGALSYVFQYKDHLGNIRVSYAQNSTTHVLEIIDENNYYPFGLKHKGYNDYVETNNKYKYNGKELQDELQLNVYDYGARNYDPALGRWMNIDPLIELMRDNSTYSYSFNNPVSFVDDEGLIPLPQIVHFSRISSGFGIRVHPISGKTKGHGGG